jgi:hypothetical protein
VGYGMQCPLREVRARRVAGEVIGKRERVLLVRFEQHLLACRHFCFDEAFAMASHLLHGHGWSLRRFIEHGMVILSRGLSCWSSSEIYMGTSNASFGSILSEARTCSGHILLEMLDLD